MYKKNKTGSSSRIHRTMYRVHGRDQRAAAQRGRTAAKRGRALQEDARGGGPVQETGRRRHEGPGECYAGPGGSRQGNKLQDGQHGCLVRH